MPKYTLERAIAPQNHTPVRVPIATNDGAVQLDPWWGTIQPMSLHPDIPTYGELEMITHIESEGIVIDTRLPEYVAQSGIIPGAIAIPWEKIVDEIEKMNIANSAPIALYCNGPQCAATPRAIQRLLDAGFEAKRLRYYRGGLMDWMGQGLPVTPAAIK
jgi:rhodanese-related sulfurtransferase